MSEFLSRRGVLGVSAGLTAAATIPELAWAQSTDAAAKPSAPTEPRPAVATYAQTPMVDQIALSPDGKRVAVVTQKDDTNYLLFFDVADQKVKTIGLGQAKVRDLMWGSNTHVVLTTSATISLPMFAGGRHEFYLGRSIDLNTMKVRTFFAREDKYYGIVFGHMQRIKVDGEYRVTAANRHMADGYEFNLFSFGFDSEVGKRLVLGNNATKEFVVAPDGRPVAYADFDDDRKQWDLYFNTALQKGKVDFKRVYIQKGEALNYPDLLGLGRDGNSVVIRVYTGGDDDQIGFREISADGTLSEPLDPEGAGKPRSALFHPTTWRLAGFSRNDDWFTEEWSDPLMKKLYDALPQVLGQGARTRIASYAEDPRKMIVYTEDARDAGSYFFCDFTNGDVISVAVNYPDLPQEWITEKQAIVYKAADGLEIHGYLTLPPFKEGKNLPLVALPHGGPHARDRINFDWQSQVLAAHGYAVLQPNFRGSSGYGSDFAIAGYGEFGRKMQTDISDGVRYLAAKGIVDPKRVAIMGASYGGYAALAGATLDPGVYRCAVSVAGVTDPRSFIEYVDMQTGDSQTSVLYWKQLMGTGRESDGISPVKQAAKAYCPILLMHGSDDTIVPIDQSKRMDKALKAAGKPVEFITYKGQDHWETRGTARVAMMEAALSFLQKHNPA
ncbi:MULTISPECIES: S9 family peptidase [Asticcacaulis]|uniref:alpha/beta hydrolase family protein n=1 Tax=Asticcacaulis TaxID=76890 RepID=UPI001AEA245D|nr:MULTISPECIES: S9 family peptidase [Asticcacaulis]MBP2160935.1 dipeptidyl aminopeptidase/acylaminoacyl peptidase [Asticcacaulis solisilvae]MDR6801861.1 dipeptidyl aminopeptidase/acylaminoacyl peptidase [Asticcacaulis sp. BE141]